MRIWLVMLLIIAPALSLAAPVQLFDEVLVVGGDTDGPSDPSQVNIESNTGFVRVVDRSSFEQKFTTLEDLLDKQLGVQIKRVGGAGSYSTVALRGSPGSQVNVFLDGVLLNSSQGGKADISLIPLSSVERIEIYPDHTPVQLGNSNVAGAINVVTHQALEEEYQTQVSAGSFGTRSASFLAAGSKNRLSFSLALERLDADNDYPTVLRSGDEETRVNSDVSNLAGYLKLGYMLDDSSTINFISQIIDHDRGLPSIQNDSNDQSRLENEGQRHQLSYLASYLGLKASHEVADREYTTTLDQRKNPVGLSTDWLENKTQRRSLRNHWLLALDNHNIRFVYEYAEEKFYKTNLSDSQLQIKNSRREQVFAIQDEWLVYQEDLRLSLSARQILIEDEAVVRQEKIGFEQDDVDSDVSVSKAAYHVGAAYTVDSGFRIKANLSQGLRFPTMMELYAESERQVGNPDLKPEESVNLDFGIEYSYPGLELTAAVYRKDLSNFIAQIYGGQGQAKPINIGDSVLSGFEANVSYQVTPWLELGSTIDLVDSEAKTRDRGRDETQLPGVYHENYSAKVAMDFYPVLLELQHFVSDDMYYDQPNLDLADTSEHTDFSLTWYVNQLTVNASVNNILDKRYREFDTFSNVGRAYYLSLNYKW